MARWVSRFACSLVVVSMAFVAADGWAKDKKSRKKKPNPAAPAVVDPGFRDCSSAREFLTTYRFLQANRSTALTPADAERMALKVAEGCDGAAGRFIKTYTLLQRAGVVYGDAIKQAADMASEEPVTATTFDGVFARCFAGDGLDLDLGTAVRTARQIAFDYDGDKTWAESDFVEIVRFLSSASGGAMSNPEAARLAARLLSAAETHRKSVARSFTDTYEYLTSRSGPNLARPDALALAEKILFVGPVALANFREAYQFADAEGDKGMGKERPDAIKLAMSVAALSRQNDEDAETAAPSVAPAIPADAPGK